MDPGAGEKQNIWSKILNKLIFIVLSCVTLRGGMLLRLSQQSLLWVSKRVKNSFILIISYSHYYSHIQICIIISTCRDIYDCLQRLQNTPEGRN